VQPNSLLDTTTQHNTIAIKKKAILLLRQHTDIIVQLYLDRKMLLLIYTCKLNYTRLSYLTKFYKICSVNPIFLPNVYCHYNRINNIISKQTKERRIVNKVERLKI